MITIMTLSFRFSIMRGTADGMIDERSQFGETEDKNKRGIALLKEDCQPSGTRK